MNATSPFSRRTVSGLILAGGLVGAGWATGLGVLARGVHPQVFVLGKNDWQVVLLEHGSARVVVLLGDGANEADAALEIMLSSLRQHVDVVIGERQFLAELGTSNRKWKSATHIVLDAENLSTVSGRSVTPSGSVTIQAGDIAIEVVQQPRNAWLSDRAPEWVWHVTASVGAIGLTMAHTIDIASIYAPETAALLVAPTLGSDAFPHVVARRSLAVNADSVRDTFIQAETEDAQVFLVRTFTTEPAMFRIRAGRISLPDWAQRLTPGAVVDPKS